MTSNHSEDSKSDRVQAAKPEECKGLENTPDINAIRNSDGSSVTIIKASNPDKWNGSFTGADEKLPALHPEMNLAQAEELERKLNSNSLILDNCDGTYVTGSGVIDLRNEPVQSTPRGDYSVENLGINKDGTEKLLFKLDLGESDDHKNEVLTTDQIGMLALQGNEVAKAGTQILNALDKSDTQLRSSVRKDVTSVISSAGPQNSSKESMNEIGAALVYAGQRFIQEQQDRALGATIGTIQGVGDLTMGIATILEFTGDVIIGNKERAAEKGEKFGEAIGKTLVGGVKLFSMADAYLFDIGYTGDYSKPFRDIATVGRALDRKWSELPPLEQERLKYKFATDIVGGLLPIGGAAKIAKADRLTMVIEEAAVLANELSVDGKVASKTIGTLVDDVTKIGAPLERAANGVENVDEITRTAERLAGGTYHKYKFFDEVPAPDMVRQFSEDSCVSACGEVLSGGKLTQRELIELIDAPADPADLGRQLKRVLEGDWECKYAKNVFQDLMEKNLPWAAEIYPPHPTDISHLVLVDGFDELGNLVIRDPWEATRYKMTREEFFENAWTGRAVYDRDNLIKVNK